MDWICIIGWVLALVFAIGCWIEHRGVAGIKADLEDAKREVQKRVK